MWIGSDKQIAFARACMRGAKAWYAQPRTRVPGGPEEPLSQVQVNGVEVLERLDAGDIAGAQAILDGQNWPGWVALCIECGDPPRIKAGAVIDALKRAYYAARDSGLVDT